MKLMYTNCIKTENMNALNILLAFLCGECGNPINRQVNLGRVRPMPREYITSHDEMDVLAAVQHYEQETKVKSVFLPPMEVFAQRQLDRLLEQDDIPVSRLYEIGKKALALKKEYGALTCEDWRRYNWGTLSTLMPVRVRYENFSMSFQSEGNVLESIVHEAAHANPGIGFHWIYTGESSGAHGVYINMNGALRHKYLTAKAAEKEMERKLPGAK